MSQRLIEVKRPSKTPAEIKEEESIKKKSKWKIEMEEKYKKIQEDLKKEILEQEKRSLAGKTFKKPKIFRKTQINYRD